MQRWRFCDTAYYFLSTRKHASSFNMVWFSDGCVCLHRYFRLDNSTTAIYDNSYIGRFGDSITDGHSTIRQFGDSTIRQRSLDDWTIQQITANSTIRQLDNGQSEHSTIQHIDDSTKHLQRFDNGHSTIRQFGDSTTRIRRLDNIRPLDDSTTGILYATTS